MNTTDNNNMIFTGEKTGKRIFRKCQIRNIVASYHTVGKGNCGKSFAENWNASVGMTYKYDWELENILKVLESYRLKPKIHIKGQFFSSSGEPEVEEIYFAIIIGATTHIHKNEIILEMKSDKMISYAGTLQSLRKPFIFR
jgi:hypothetical protein